jgi:23S rRNA pseudouridine1911/1915/1917 synthase
MHPEPPPTDFVGGQRLEFVVEKADAGRRLDLVVPTVLARLGHAVTRGEVQRWVAQGLVSVDGKPGNPSSKSKLGQTVVVIAGTPQVTAAEADPSVVFTTLFEDDFLLVLDKPAGLVVHPAKGHETGTLVNGLLAHGGFDLLAEPDALVPEGPLAHVRPGIVHRLDKGTSGVMVVAKRDTAREGLKRLFAAHDLERRYVALVAGVCREGIRTSLHGRHPADRMRFTTRVREGKSAETRVTIVERFGSLATKVSCELTTGRTHQIRVHLTELGETPVLGDPVYGSAKQFEPVRAVHRSLTHQALHAQVLGFVHPITGEALRFETAPPADFLAAESALRALRES